MGKKLISMLLLFSILKCGAQVSLTVLVPPNGVLLKNQLWNIGLVYTGNVPLRVRIGLTLTDVTTNQPVITATSGSITLSNGARQLQATDASPIQYQYPSPAVTDRNPDGFLSVGNYQACYTVIKEDKVNPSPLAEDCVTFEVAPLSPPQLNSPANEDTILTTMPQLNWLPPTPASLFSNLSYRINIVKVSPGQSPVDAIEQNIPVYTNQDISDVFVNYPSSGVQLDTGKQYAWQIVALNNLQPAAQSEVWAFYIGSTDILSSAINNNYILLDNNGNGRGVYFVSNANIGIKYFSYDKEHSAEISFIDNEGKLVKAVNEKVGYGDNYLRYTLNSAFKRGKVYFIQINDLHNNKYSASFSIK